MPNTKPILQARKRKAFLRDGLENWEEIQCRRLEREVVVCFLIARRHSLGSRVEVTDDTLASPRKLLEMDDAPGQARTSLRALEWFRWKNHLTERAAVLAAESSC
ncbi:hypothetical protein CDAR_579211 [Caerostris darwini]|uniref:Uncharacterized protein n=1 Tax=Caerostris darwini TaxID=1538125 RepID=A0AAV4RQY0_9ARAC|nr:hypothetical protein CDAR_579211 [Caerostris darwini]